MQHLKAKLAKKTNKLEEIHSCNVRTSEHTKQKDYHLHTTRPSGQIRSTVKRVETIQFSLFVILTINLSLNIQVCAQSRNKLKFSINCFPNQISCNLEHCKLRKVTDVANYEIYELIQKSCNLRMKIYTASPTTGTSNIEHSIIFKLCVLVSLPHEPILDGALE